MFKKIIKIIEDFCLDIRIIWAEYMDHRETMKLRSKYEKRQKRKNLQKKQ